MNSSQTTPNPKYLPCTTVESKTVRCYNGGKCYAVIINTQKTIECHCPEGFAGKGCNEKFIPHDGGPVSADLLVSVLVVGVVIIVLAIVAFLIWHIFLRKRFLAQNSEQVIVIAHHKETGDADNGASQVDGTTALSVAVHTEVAVGPRKVSQGQGQKKNGQRPARRSKDNSRTRPAKGNLPVTQ